MSESITGDPKWEEDFAEQTKLLDADPETRAVNTYISIQQETVKQINELYPELDITSKEFIAHMTSGYRKEVDPQEKEKIFERITAMAQAETNAIKKGNLEKVIELIMRGVK